MAVCSGRISAPALNADISCIFAGAVIQFTAQAMTAKERRTEGKCLTSNHSQLPSAPHLCPLAGIVYDANPRDHLSRARDMISGAQILDYAKFRYAAFDLRLAIETTFQEILSACYQNFSKTFAHIYQGKAFIAEIRTQNPDFDLKNRLLPLILQSKKKIAHYPALDLDRLSSMLGKLGDHLHHQGRYDTKKRSKDRIAMLRALVTEVADYLDSILQHPRYWVEFYDADLVYFEEVLSEKRSVADFEKHVAAGRLRNFAIIDVHHLPSGLKPEPDSSHA